MIRPAALLFLAACASERPADPCETAWTELDGLRRGMSELGVDARAPTRDRFLEACRSLPADARGCLSPAEALRDPTCAERLSALPEATREALSLDASEDPH